MLELNQHLFLNNITFENKIIAIYRRLTRHSTCVVLILIGKVYKDDISDVFLARY